MLRNREGRSVDPVPFLVVTGMGFLGTFSFVPVYCLALGVPVSVALLIATAVFVVLAAGAYYRLVWGARPEVKEEVSAGLRLENIFYMALVVTGVLLLLTLILLAR